MVRSGTWLDYGPGVAHVAVGMHRQGFDLQLTQYDERGWRATFYTSGMEHSPTSAIGTSWEKTPWHAVQRAAWGALKRAESGQLSAVLLASEMRWRPIVFDLAVVIALWTIVLLATHHRRMRVAVDPRPNECRVTVYTPLH